MSVAAEPATAVRRRRFPHPFRAMLAISTDVDRSAPEVLRGVHRFLNTRAPTPAGRGVGLDVASSLWVFRQRAGQLGLCVPDGAAPEADELAAYARAGWIDALHTYGVFSPGAGASFTREHAAAALEELRARELTLPVWVNRAGRANAQNFGAHPEMAGDLVGSVGYHSDLLLDYGVRFIWNQRHASDFGMDSLLTPVRLRDGRRLWGFPRFTTESGPAATEIAAAHELPVHHDKHGTPKCLIWWPWLLHHQLSEARLEGLIARGQYCVVGQHLGVPPGAGGFGLQTREALARVAALHEAGRLLVTRTSRLLEYDRVTSFLEFRLRRTGRLDIDIVGVRDPVLGTFVPTIEQLRGVTFYVPDPDATLLYLNGRLIPRRETLRAPSDGTAPSIGVRWFPPDLTDHSEPFVAAQP